jgi:uncharacterized oxidoreductase
MNIQGNTILITGGNSGIGRELAHRLHDLGNRVIVTGRRADALAQTVEGRARMSAHALDMNDGDAIGPWANKIVAAHPELNVLVNNAGIMRYENAAAERDLADAEETVATNLLGPIRLINALVTHLGSRPNAALINVTSGLAFVPLAGAPTYSATKAALHSYTQSLRHQLRGRVEVIEVAPPGVRTELTPGQSKVQHFVPLADYIEETMALLQQQPTPAEILVERVKFQRNAEAEGRFDKTFGMLNPA